ncbi:MAG: tRNA-dihydrouridine synthase [Betaproteobacteria bacterium]
MNPAQPQLLLAPMEGLLDFVLRDVLTRIGGFDRCVCEFIRITDQLLPPRVFVRVMPELLHGSRTEAGVPVRAQLLGSDPVCMADNAARLAELGSDGVDLNFGCPAKVVNRHGGGAVLLQDPEQLYRIVSAVRKAVPAAVPVSAKMRLGFAHDRLAEVCAQAIEAGGASELVVHARTKVDGYRPPAYWPRVCDVRAAVSIPVVANGEIWSVTDARRCLQESGVGALMLGRGAVVDPALAWQLRQALGWPDPALGPARPAALDWQALLPHIAIFWQRVCERIEPRARAGRLKQWLNFLRRASPQAEAAYQQLRTVNDSLGVGLWLQQALQQARMSPERPELASA